MDHKLHLVVIQPTAHVLTDEEPTQISRLWNSNRVDVRWNDSFTAFRLTLLRWWDDASYARYQAGDDYEKDEAAFEQEEYERSLPAGGLCSADSWGDAKCDVREDEIPF